MNNHNNKNLDQEKLYSVEVKPEVLLIMDKKLQLKNADITIIKAGRRSDLFIEKALGQHMGNLDREMIKMARSALRMAFTWDEIEEIKSIPVLKPCSLEVKEIEAEDCLNFPCSLDDYIEQNGVEQVSINEEYSGLVELGKGSHD